MSSEVLDAWILRLKHKDRVLGEAFEFVIKQLQDVQAQVEGMSTASLLSPGGPENATLYQAAQGTIPEIGVLDRSVQTHYVSATLASYQIGTSYYNRFDTTGVVSLLSMIPVTNGQRAIITNVGAGLLNIVLEDTGQPAEYRITSALGYSSVILSAGESVFVWYDSITQRWRLASIGPSHLPAPTIIEVNLGNVALLSGSFFVSDSTLLTGRPVIIMQSAGPYTGKGTRTDEAEMDQLVVVGNVTSVMGFGTIMQAYWQAVESPMLGNVKFQYWQV